MAKKRGGERFLFVYLIIAFGFGLVGLGDALLSLAGFSSMVYAWMIGVLAFLFFFFNIFALVHFMQERLEKITWVLPIYHLVSYVVFFCLGIFLGLMELFLRGVMVFLGVLGILTSGFEIGFSLYLLRRFGFF